MTELQPELKYERAIMTDRRAATLAPKLGHKSVERFAASLPPEAQVADIGAGLSTLGDTVCTIRPDVEWFNVDVQYDDFGTMRYANRFDALADRKPENLEYIAADALDLEETFGPDRFDRVVSYWMIQYLIIKQRELAVAAAENMLAVGKPSGTVAVGPVYWPWTSMDAMRSRAKVVTPAESEDGRTAQAEELVKATTMPSGQARKIRGHWHEATLKRTVSFKAGAYDGTAIAEE